MDDAGFSAEKARARLQAILERADLQQDGNVLFGHLDDEARRHCVDEAARPGVIRFVRALLSSDNSTDRLIAVALAGSCKLAELKAELQAAAASESGIRRLFMLMDGHKLDDGYDYGAQLRSTIDSL